MTREEEDKLIELSDLNREDNIKYISSEAQGIAITLDSDRYAPTFCKLERAYICGRRKSEKKIEEFESKIADIKANCDLAIEGRDVKIMELEKDYKALQTSYNILKDNDEKIIKEMGEQIEKMKCCGNCKYRDDMTSYCKKHKKEIYIFMVDSKCNDWKLFD